jgi:hypothetical protein
MSVYVYTCLCFSVSKQRPCDGLIPRPRSPTDCVKDQETEKKAAKAQQSCRAISREIARPIPCQFVDFPFPI